MPGELTAEAPLTVAKSGGDVTLAWTFIRDERLAKPLD